MTPNPSQIANRKMTVILAVFIVIFNASFGFGQNSGDYPWQYFWQKSLSTSARKDYADFLENARKAVEKAPANHPTLFYNLARAYSLTGNKTEAVKWLEKTLDLGFGSEALAGDDFLFLLEAPEFAALRKRIERVRKPQVLSKTALIVREPDLIPESLAFDAKEKSFYIGSMYKQKVVKIDARGVKSDFVTEGADGLGAVVGIKIDDKQRNLLVLSNVAPEMKNFEKSREGIGMLHRYDLKTGRLIEKHALENKPRPHLLNDLIVTNSGDIFITDSLSSTVHVLKRNGKNQLKIFAELAPYSYPNGIAFSKDESKIYVATLNGVIIVDAKTGKTTPLEFAETIALSGIDGLYFYRNSLLAIQNFESPNRVVRFDLNEAGTRVIRATLLESNHPLYKIPTTGAIVGNIFYYIANSQLRSFDTNVKLLPIEKLQDIQILRLGL